MSIRDAQKLHIAMGYCLLLLSVPALATETQIRDPFSDGRSTSDQADYPSVLTSPDFESNVRNIKVQPPAAAPKPLPGKANAIKTPVIPAVSSGTLPVKGYVQPPSIAPLSYATRALVLHENVLLSQGLNQWAKDSGYKMLWNSSKDYVIYSTITYTGATTDDVLGDLGKLFASENYGLVIKLYQKNKVLVVDEQ